MSAAIEARQLGRRFGDFVAVDSVDLTVQRGELFGLLGPNGAGKTTIIRMLTGLTKIGSGSATVAGVEVQREPTALRRVIGVVPQALTSDLDLTGYENLDIYARFFSMPRAARSARIAELLQRMELWERRKDLVSTYSGGMRRRLEIARGLIHRPQVLFLDEPTIGLDPQSRHVIWEILRELREAGDLTISLTTHYLDEAEVLCDRVAIIDRGKLVALGSPDTLKASIPGSDALQLTLSTEPAPALVQQLQALPGVRKLEVVRSSLEARVDQGAALLPRFIELVSKSGITVASATISRISLEDVFIALTGRSLRDAHATGSEANRAMLPRRFS